MISNLHHCLVAFSSHRATFYGRSQLPQSEIVKASKLRQTIRGGGIQQVFIFGNVQHLCTRSLFQSTQVFDGPRRYTAITRKALTRKDGA